MEDLIYIGNYASYGVSLFQFSQGILKHFGNGIPLPNCSYLCQNKKFLYSVVEISQSSLYPGGYILAYKKKANNLELLNYQPSYGKDPCFITLDDKNGLLFVAHYTEGSFSIFKVETNGYIGNILYHHKFDSLYSHIHGIFLSNDNQFIFVIDTGCHKIYAYQIYTEGTQVSIVEKFYYSFPPKTEPRHLVLGKNGLLYIITELSCQLIVLYFNNQFGFTFVSSHPLFSSEICFNCMSFGSAIKISQDYHYLYTTIRGHDSISVFKIEDTNLTMIQNISCYGHIPRDLSLNSTENYVLVANQSSNTISIFLRNHNSGTLSFVNSVPSPLPTCLLFD